MKNFRFFLLLLFSVPVFAQNPQEQEAVLKDLSGGMYSYPSPNRIPDNAAAYIQNFYTDIEPLVVERDGYVRRDDTQLGNPSPVYGLWEFVDSSGNDWIISYSSRTFYKNTIGGTPTAFGLVSTVDQIPDCATNLGVIMCVNGTDAAWTFDGTSTAVVSGAPLGTLIEPWRNRFAIANIGGEKSTVRFSEDGDETSWTLGGNPTDPFSIQIGGADDGDYVRCLIGTYLDSMVIGRKFDLWALDGFDQADVFLRNVSKNVGCIESRTPQEVDGELVFLSARGLEAMAGRSIRNISEPVRNITDVISRNTVDERSNTQTTQADFEAGSFPASHLSTTISPGDVVLSTLAASSQSDNSSAFFSSGTLTQVTYFTSDYFPSTNSLTLSFETSNTVQQSTLTTVTGNTPVCAAVSQGLISNGTYLLTGMDLSLKKVGSPASSYLVEFLKDGVVVTTISIGTAGISTSGGLFSFSFSFPYYRIASAGGSYSIRLSPESGACDGSNHVAWEANGSGIYIYRLKKSNYYTTGKIVSRSWDLGVTTNTWLWAWGNITDNETVPVGTGLTFETQSSADNVSWESLTGVSTGAVIPSTVQRYVRYVASFTTTDVSLSPRLSSATMNADAFVSTGGIFTSQLLSIGSLISSWGPVSISQTASSGTITFQFGSTSAASVSSITNWASITNGGIPSVSTNPYAAFRMGATATFAGADLRLGSFQTTWDEGGIVPSPVAGVVDRRYWLSYTTSTASTPFLDSVLVWQRNKSFTLLKGINAGSFSFWRDDFYFGNSNDTGYVYKSDFGDNDDGSDISSILKTKSYDLGTSYRDKSFRNNFLTFLGNSLYSGSYTAQYTVDQSTQAYSLGTISMGEGTGQVLAKLPFPFENPVQGREIQYTITKSGSGSRLRLFEIVLKYMTEEED